MHTVSLKLRCLLWGLVCAALSVLSWAQTQSSQNQSQSQSNQTQSAQNQSSTASQDSSSQNSSDSENSLAGAAKTAKIQKAAHAKKVFTDEDMDATDGPLPRLKMDGPDNIDEILSSVFTYKSTHNAEQTEQAVHMWYDKYDQMMAAAIQENQIMTTLRSTNVSNGYTMCQESQDYQKCASRQMAEQRGAVSDSQEYGKNFTLMTRIQQSFQKVRSGLQIKGLNYGWFKIRNMNNSDTY